MGDVAPVLFARDRLGLIEAGEQATHFWYAPRRALLLDTILRAGVARDAPLLDVGCGTGGLVAELLRHGFDAHGVDPWAAQASDGRAAARLRPGQAEALPWPDASVAAACAFDVIEHVDDVVALRELQRVLRPGGHLFLSVPAHAWLWSARDTLAGHRRRYTRRLLRERVGAAGFTVERLFGYQLLLLPVLAAARGWARLRGDVSTAHEDAPRPWVNALLLLLNRSEVAAGRVGRPPTGSSLLLVARKPGGARP
jgi:SAM-dependent methyltransferase